MSVFEQRRLPIGVESFEEICADEEYYYVDKTAMIAEFMRRRGKVNLFTRPRRFGKSLNMSMLKCFFEIGRDKTMFDGLAIASETALCERYMGKYPVISISLKGVDGLDFASARSMLCMEIGLMAMKFDELSSSDRLTDVEKELYARLTGGGQTGQEVFVMDDSVIKGSLKILSGLLEKHYGKKVVVLIDEYDTPLTRAEQQADYDEMASLIRGMFEQGFKTNNSLEFAVLTGCPRVAMESTAMKWTEACNEQAFFAGLNNLKVFGAMEQDCDSYFGFTDKEVKQMLAHYELDDKYELIKTWYGRYRFGDTDIYCPWDVINYVKHFFYTPCIRLKHSI